MTTLVLHWGRTGAGPIFLGQLFAAVNKTSAGAALMSYSSSSEAASHLKSLSVNPLVIRTWRSPRSAALSLIRIPVVIVRFVRYTRRHGVARIVIAMEHPYQVPVLIVARALGLDVVLVVHDANLHPGENSRFMVLQRRFAFKSCHAYVALSDEVARILRAQFAGRGKRIWVSRLPPMLDSRRLARPRRLPEGRPIRVGMFGRVVKYKGYGLAVSACEQLVAAGQHLILELVGKGIRAEMEDLGVGPKPWLVLRDEWVSDGAIPDLLNGFDVVLLPYLEASQSGVLNEAAAMGIPVACTPVGALPAQARETGAGTVAERVDAPGLAAAILALVADPATYARASQAGVDSGGRGWEHLARTVLTEMAADAP